MLLPLVTVLGLSRLTHQANGLTGVAVSKERAHVSMHQNTSQQRGELSAAVFSSEDARANMHQNTTQQISGPTAVAFASENSRLVVHNNITQARREQTTLAASSGDVRGAEHRHRLSEVVNRGRAEAVPVRREKAEKKPELARRSHSGTSNALLFDSQSDSERTYAIDYFVKICGGLSIFWGLLYFLELSSCKIPCLNHLHATHGYEWDMRLEEGLNVIFMEAAITFTFMGLLALRYRGDIKFFFILMCYIAALTYAHLRSIWRAPEGQGRGKIAWVIPVILGCIFVWGFVSYFVTMTRVHGPDPTAWESLDPSASLNPTTQVKPIETQ